MGVPVEDWWDGPSHFALTRGNSTLTTGNNEYDDANTSMIFLESNWNGANFNNLDRVQWPSMKVSGDNTLSKIYLSYYDTTQKIIKFRYIENGASVTSGYTTDNRFGSKTTQIMYTAGATRTYYVEQAISVYTSGGKTYDQGYVCIAGADSNSPYSAVNFTNDGTAIVSWYDAKNGVLKMKYNTSPATSFSGYQTFSTVPGTGTVTFKISVDGGAAKDASVTYSNVANGQRNNHEFAYQLGKYLSENGFGAYAEVDPKSNLVTVRSMQTGPGSSISITNLSNGAVNAGVTGCGNAWVERTIDDAAVGKFVALEVDGKNGIHMAYNDTANGDLKYAYLSSVSGTPQVVTVDGYQQTGSYIDLALKNETLDGTSCIVPYISYYCTSYTDSTNAARVARLRKPLIPSATGSDATFTSANGAGAVDDMLTDIWEVVAIPTAGIPDQYRVNIGVKTNGDVIVGYLADKQIEYVKVW